MPYLLFHYFQLRSFYCAISRLREFFFVKYLNDINVTRHTAMNVNVLVSDYIKNTR